MRNIRRILIRSANWIGDAVMTIPAVRAVRENFPGAEISILAKPWVAPVFENNPHADHLLIYDASGRHRGFSGKFRLARDLKTHHFDAAILFQNAFEAAFIAFLAGIPNRIGYDTDGRSLLLSHRVRCLPEIRKVHQVRYYLGILEGAGLRTGSDTLHLEISPGDRHRAREMLREYGITPEERPLIGINPGATFGTAKRWFPERYAALCQRLQSSVSADILVFGGPGEEALGHRICQDIGKRCVSLCGKTTLREAIAMIKEEAMGHRICQDIGKRCVSLCGKTTLREAIALIKECRLFITNDSGLMHVAAALDVPQIAIFGSTDHITTAPASPKSHIIRVPTPCSPCLKPDCPEGHHRCMKEITVDMVYSVASKQLSV